VNEKNLRRPGYPPKNHVLLGCGNVAATKKHAISYNMKATTEKTSSIKTETKREKPPRHWQRPCAVGFEVPTDWDDTKDIP
jgi:hypothetical protein